MLMLDLGAGLKGASQAMKVRGWQVITMDIDPRFNCDVTADIRTWHYQGKRPDLIWCSMPCDQFSRESMPWCRTGKLPDMSLVLSGKRVIDEAQPVYWVMENVRGAIPYFEPYFGKFRMHVGPFYLWGFFPIPGRIDTNSWRKKESRSSSNPEERARIPLSLSGSIAEAIELQTTF
jgi:hypothetical protein